MLEDELVKTDEIQILLFSYLILFLAVEHLIREDYKIEAMDRIEAYVDILLMRLQLIKDRPYVFACLKSEI